MKTLWIMLVFCALSGLLSGCTTSQHPKPYPTFSGLVTSNTGTSLADASVTINGITKKTREDGSFELMVSPAPQYIVTIRKRGYGLFSRVYAKEVEPRNWTLNRATLTTLDPAVGGVVQDTQAPNCLAARPNSGWAHLEVQGGPVSPDLRTALNLAYSPAGCSTGVSINIPPNALVDANGNNPPPLVEVEVSTVDVFSPEAMPGDWGVRFPQNLEDYKSQSSSRQGFMQTLGAGSVTITAGEKPYQLKSDQKARLTIPIDPTAIELYQKLDQSLPAKIPLLQYQEKEGLWKSMGMASLNDAATAYIADLPHFSEWNMDVVFSDVACTQIDSRLIDGGYYLKAVPSVIHAGGLQPHEFDVSNSSSCSTGDPFFCFIQAAWRLPSIAHGPGQISFMPGTRTGATITYNRANFVVLFGAKAPNQSQMPPTYIPSGTAGQPGNYPNCTTKVTFADKPTLTVATTLAALTFTASGYWGPNATIVPNNATDRYELQWCNTSTNSCATDPNYPQNPNAGGWTTFMALPNMSPTGPRPARSATSSPPILRNSLAAGTYQFRVRTHVGHSSFGVGGYDTPWSDATASITIVGNSPPTLASIGNQTVNVGTTVSLMASASDPDGGPLTYSITAFPAGATINSTTGAFSWTPLPAQGAMTHTVTVQVMDSGGLTNTKSFTITVRPQIKIENRMGGGPATGCATPIDTSMVRLQVQSSDKLVPLRTDTADGSIPQYGAAGPYIAAGSDSMTFDTTATTYTVVIEMGSWNAGGSGGFVQRRYAHNNATDGCTLGRYRYLDFTVNQSAGLLTLRVQPSGNQYQVIVQGGTATLSTAAVGQKAITDFGRTTPHTP